MSASSLAPPAAKHLTRASCTPCPGPPPFSLDGRLLPCWWPSVSRSRLPVPEDRSPPGLLLNLGSGTPYVTPEGQPVVVVEVPYGSTWTDPGADTWACVFWGLGAERGDVSTAVLTKVAALIRKEACYRFLCWRYPPGWGVGGVSPLHGTRHCLQLPPLRLTLGGYKTALAPHALRYPHPTQPHPPVAGPQAPLPRTSPPLALRPTSPPPSSPSAPPPSTHSPPRRRRTCTALPCSTPSPTAAGPTPPAVTPR
jgi:hypothetical protein